MFNLPNLISISRIPLALCFLQENPLYRTIALLVALITDGLDGYIARRYGQTSRLGTLLDPLTDKFFVILVGTVFVQEGRLTLIEAAMLISRDFSIFFFGCYLLLRSHFSQFHFRAIWCGKITTVLQFGVLFALIWGVVIPPLAFGIFIMLGILALIELYLSPYELRDVRE